MAERVKYLGVTMEAATAEVLARLEPEQRVPTSGLWLYAITRAISYYQFLVESDNAYIINWLALASQFSKGPFEVVVPEASAEALRATIIQSGWNPDFIYTKFAHPMVWSHEGDGIRFIDDSATSARKYPVTPAYGASAELIITPVHHTVPMNVPDYESVVIGGAWRLYGGAKIPYAATEREKLVAILLAAIAPKTLALGQNVIFDGKLKPQKSKINFSGTGGQIGEGDLLICNPDDLNRYSPLPGAVALVLGEVTEPVHAFTCALPVGDEVLTLVIK